MEECIIGRSEDLQSLSGRLRHLLKHSAEDLAALSTGTRVQHDGLASLYDDFRSSESELRTRVVRHPLFTWSIRTLSAGLGNPSMRDRSQDAISTLRALFLDGGLLSDDQVWMRLNSVGRLDLPFTKVIFDAGRQNAGRRVHLIRDGKRRSVTLGESSLSLLRPEDALVSVATLPDLAPIRLWALDDEQISVDSFTSPYQWEAPERWQVRSVDAESYTQWRQTLSGAAELISSIDSSAWQEVANLVSAIVPVRTDTYKRHLSCSSTDLPGVVWMSWTPDTLQIAEALIHEAGHNKLYLYELDGPLIANNRGARLQSPWRNDLRPPRGLLHGAFAFSGVATVWTELLESDVLSSENRKRVRQDRAVFRSQVLESISTIESNCTLTSTGKKIVGKIKESVDQMPNEDLPKKKISVKKENISSDIKKINLSKDDKLIFDKISSKNSGVLGLLENTYNKLRPVISTVCLPRWLEDITYRCIDGYFLKWCLPLAEASDLDYREPQLSKWMAAHISCGLLWRYLDLAIDGQCSTEKQATDCQKAALTIMPAVQRRITSLGIQWTDSKKTFLFYFLEYNSKKERSPKPDNIWKRATPFVIIPKHSPDEINVSDYKSYINLLGIIDDVEDITEDLINDRITWVTDQIYNLSTENAKENILLSGKNLSKNISASTNSNSPIWSRLISESVKQLEKKINEMDNVAE